MCSRGAAIAAGALVAAVAVLAACGKKGDPEPPLLPIPQAATDLAVEQRGTELILRLAYPRTTAAGNPLPPLERVEVYELVRPALPAPAPPPPAAAPAAETVETEGVAEAPAAPAGEPAAGEPAAAEPATAEPAAGAPGAEPVVSQRDAEPAPGDAGAAGAEPEAGLSSAEPAPGEPEPGTGFAAGVAAPAAPGRYLPPAVDPREFAAVAAVVRTLHGEELGGAVHGDRLVVALPLPSPLPQPPQAHLFAVRTAAEGGFVSAFSNRAAIVPEPPPPAPRGLTAAPRAEGIEIAWEAGAAGETAAAPAAEAAAVPTGETAEPAAETAPMPAAEAVAEPAAEGAAGAAAEPAAEIAAAGPVGFHVYRRLATERGFGPPLQLVGRGQRSFLDRGARYGQRYIYAVTAVARRVPLVESAIAAAREVDYRDVFAPPVPAGLVALADEGAVRLVWDESRVPDLAGYRLYRRRGDGPWQPLTAEPVTAVEYTDADVAAGETYRYRVTAVDALGNESEPGAEAAALGR